MFAIIAHKVALKVLFSRERRGIVGDYKKQPNEVGSEDTVLPKNVHSEISRLISDYNRR